MGFAQRLQERRKNIGITQVQLAEMLGVTKGAIGNYEAGISSPRADILYRVFEVLQCDANFLFQDEMRTTVKNSSSTIETVDKRLNEIAEIFYSLNEDGKDYLHKTAHHCSFDPEYKKRDQSKKMA